MDNPVVPRIIIDIILGVSVIFGWWFVALPLGVISAWALPAYVEFVFAGFVYDCLYGMNSSAGWFGWAGSLVSIILLALVYGFKRIVR